MTDEAMKAETAVTAGSGYECPSTVAKPMGGRDREVGKTLEGKVLAKTDILVEIYFWEN